MNTDAIAALRAAVRALPTDVGLRLVLAEKLLEHGFAAEALEQATTAVTLDTNNKAAVALVSRAAMKLATPDPEIDWTQLEEQLDTPIEPPFVDTPPDQSLASLSQVKSVSLADVGGLEPVKKRLREAFLDPMNNPEIARAFGKSLRGGLMLYGPPGCGKTFIARAIAGELKARFLSVGLTDVLDMYIGESEQNVHRIFEHARRLAPVVLFLDEVDAIGARRSSNAQAGALRNVVNQLLTELDGVTSANEGIFVLAATNHPWDVDPALLRPGRFDRSVLVLPPDDDARATIIHRYLNDRPVEGIRLSEIVKKTDGYSGADLEHVCSTAAEKAMTASLAAGEVTPITMKEIDEALLEVKPSIGPWFQTARNVVSFGNADGRYDELAAFLRAKKLL